MEMVAHEKTTVSLLRALARAGVGSRSQLLEMIETGRVRVGGNLARRPGFPVEPATDRIELDQRPLAPTGPHLYFAFHKPRGVLSTRRASPGQKTLFQILPPLSRWVFPVGRLDKETSGLMLLTSDGSWAERAAHPDYRVVREYEVKLVRSIGPEAIQALRQGVSIGPGKRSLPAEVDLLSGRLRSRKLRLRIREGKRHEVRKMIRAVGGRVKSLRRVGFGPVRLGSLEPGEIRRLTRDELRGFRELHSLRGTRS